MCPGFSSVTEINQFREAMKITKILSVSVLAGAVLLSATACSAPSPEKNPESSSSSQVAPVETPTSEATPAIDEREAAAQTVNDYYAFVADPENAQKIDYAGAPVKGHGATATEAELKTMVEALPLGFQYFDTSSPDLIKNAYLQLIMGSSVMSSAKMELNMPADAVTVTGDTATVKMSKLETVVNGKKVDVPENPSMPDLKMKKDDTGNWVMIAEPIPGMEAGAQVSGSVSNK